MFDQTDQRVVAVSAMQAEPVLMNVLQQSGYFVQPTGPGMWACRAMAIYGFVPHINLRISDRNGQAEVWLHSYAEFDNNAMIIGIILFLVFWPAAAVLGYLAYDGVQKKARMVGQYAWSQLPAGGQFGAPQFGQGGPPQYGAPPNQHGGPPPQY